MSLAYGTELRSLILGTGNYMPEKVLTNHDLEKMVNTSDEWITQRTGIKERRIAAPEEASSDLGAKAALVAMEDAGIEPEEIDCIIVATITPDHFCPATACLIQEKIGAKNAAAFDISAACTGFVYALSMADAYIRSTTYETVLVIGVETLSRLTDWENRNTCILFGDGAGAAVLGAANDTDRGLLFTELGADGSLADLIIMPAGGSRMPASIETVNKKLHYMQMKGNDVFKKAVRVMSKITNSVIKKAGLTNDDVDLLIPHQANLRIIKAAGKSVHLDEDKVYVNLHKYGNTSAATTIVALDEARREGRVKEGDIVVLVGFGSGFTWGASVIKL